MYKLRTTYGHTRAKLTPQSRVMHSLTFVLYCTKRDASDNQVPCSLSVPAPPPLPRPAAACGGGEAVSVQPHRSSGAQC